ncbi:MAG TPA: type 1 glutamine amidotransferase [Burkholderiales bacterium]|nr:type 1 glutamine amidotransferase [Burkholderiales bacterium]
MKPVGIFRHARGEGPGYFATYLAERSIGSDEIALDEGAGVPRDPRRFSGLVFMGGPMSVNDELPWIAPALELIREAVRKDVPVLGHCLGAQMMSKALGGAVRANPVREIGWGPVRVSDNAVARQWLGELQDFLSFHWHGETFSIPPGATRVLENEHCANQAFALGRHFAMQCHVEMTREMIGSWLQSGREELEKDAASPGVQRAEDIERDATRRLEALHGVADRIYDRWSGGLNRGN